MGKSKPAVYWYQSKPLPNLGDELTGIILHRLFDFEFEHVTTVDDADLTVVGSNLNQVFGRKETIKREKQLDVIGSGFMHPYLRVPNVDFAKVFSVRGYLSLAMLPDSYDARIGDPGLLVDRCVPGSSSPAVRKYTVGFIPHISQIKNPLFQNLKDHYTDSVLIDFRTDNLDATVDIMRSCDIIVSQSLDGLVIADSLGIPNVWLDAGSLHPGGSFKFYDYFSSIGRPFYLKVDEMSVKEWPQISTNIFTLDISTLKRVQREILDAFHDFFRGRQQEGNGGVTIFKDQAIHSSPFNLVREAPRPIELRQKGYEEAFDHDTLWYVAYRERDGIRLDGPPLRNMLSTLSKAEWRVDGVMLDPADVLLKDRGHAQDSFLKATGEQIEVRIGDASINIVVESSQLDRFRGRKVIYTKSRNNQLDWIQDWLKFYRNAHEIDSVLIFDNGSDSYALDTLANALRGVEGIEEVAIVSWPFKFGPQAGASGLFDSDFFEYVVGSCAQHRFLAEADLVIHCDIDELVVTNDERPIREHLVESKTGYLRYHGRLITGHFNVPPTDHEDFSFENFGYFNPSSKLGTPKWACLPWRLPPETQWRTHGIDGMTTAIYDKVLHRHFYPISTSWKFNRSVVATKAGDDLEVDTQLIKSLEKNIKTG